MPLLCQYAAELDAIAAMLAKIPLGSRDADAAYVAVDEARHAVTALSSRLRLGAPARPANDRGAWTGPAVVITGFNQVICAPGRGPRR